MNKRLGLVDHNIKKATGLEVGMGRFKGTVSLTITGTIGWLTVDASDLLIAIEEIRWRWAETDDEGKIELVERHDQAEANQPRERPRKLERNTRVDVMQQQTPTSQPVVREQQKPASRPPDVQNRPLHVAKNRSSQPSSETIAMRISYEDSVIAIVSPELAAEKLRRPIREIHARRRELGLTGRDEGSDS